MSERAISIGGLPVGDVSPRDALAPVQAEVHRSEWDSCRHRVFKVDDTQRTVKCGDCGALLDPAWCLKELIWHYETRVDRRLAEIAAYDKRIADERARRAARRQNPKPRLEARRKEDLARAAYNRYQAELLLIRADKQQARADKITAQLAADDGSAE